MTPAERARAAIVAAMDRGWSVAKIADRTGVTLRTVERIITGRDRQVTHAIEGRILTGLTVWVPAPSLAYRPSPRLQAAHDLATDAACRRNPRLWTSDHPEDLEAAAVECIRTECPALDACRTAGKTEWGAWGGVIYGTRKEAA